MFFSFCWYALSSLKISIECFTLNRATVGASWHVYIPCMKKRTRCCGNSTLHIPIIPQSGRSNAKVLAWRIVKLDLFISKAFFVIIGCRSKLAVFLRIIANIELSSCCQWIIASTSEIHLAIHVSRTTTSTSSALLIVFFSLFSCLAFLNSHVLNNSINNIQFSYANTNKFNLKHNILAMYTYEVFFIDNVWI